MKTYRFIPAIVLATIFLAACSNDTPTENEQWKKQSSAQNVRASEITAADAAMRAMQVIPGKVDGIVKVSDQSGAPAWDVTVTMSREWVLVARLNAMTGGIVTMQGKFSPENFNFAPGAYFVPLSTISSIVRRDLDAEITSWTFEHDKTHNEWVYDLSIRKGNGKTDIITMSAVSRRVLSGGAA